MKYIVNANEMQLIDQYTSETIGIPSIVLMEKASTEIVALILDKLKKNDKIIAVCGTGNNGGDGAAAARILFEKGYQVEILVLGDEKHMTRQMETQLKIAGNLGISILNSAKISEYNVVIDAIFGVGLKRAVTGIYESVIQEINDSDNLAISVDLPSGISADTGKVLNTAVKADYTVTFGYMKFGLLVYPGCTYAGKVKIADIGFPDKARREVLPKAFFYEQEDLFRLPARMDYSNKGTYGKVLVIAGSRDISGACCLAAKAALRIGAGLVKVLTDCNNRTIVGTFLPEALFSGYHSEDLLSESVSQFIIKELKWPDIIIMGPGISTSPEAMRLLELVLEHRKVPAVLDADALNLLAVKMKQESGSIFLENIIFTPHLKEMSRLLCKPVSDIADNLLETAKGFTKGKNYVLVLKDARTVVSDGNEIFINTSGNHGMATGGSGDVLSGIIGGLLAQGMKLFEAAALGVYLHGLAGDYAAKEKNCYSLIASDIINALSYIIKI